MKVPNPISKFVAVFARLPSIGPRQATRLAFYFVRMGKAYIGEIASAVAELQDIKICKTCFFIHEDGNDICSICSDSHRKQDIIMVLEKETDLISIENTKKYNGRYLIIGDLKKNSTFDTQQKLRLNSLKSFIKKLPNSVAEEIIVAINPTTSGDISASFFAHELKGYAKKITRLGRGLPTGGEIEFADEETLSGALERRN